MKSKALAQMFSCEFCEISKNTRSYRTPPVAVSGPSCDSNLDVLLDNLSLLLYKNCNFINDVKNFPAFMLDLLIQI